MESPWLIQHVVFRSIPLNNPDGALMQSSAKPYSRFPARSTLPPSAAVMNCMP